MKCGLFRARAGVLALGIGALLQCVLGACTTPRVPEASAASMLQNRMALERGSALAAPGQPVCRRMPVGLTGHDWVTGVLVDGPADAATSAVASEASAQRVPAGRPTVRIVDAGRFGHAIDGAPIYPGRVLVANPEQWQPCTTAGAHHTAATKPAS